MFQNTLPYSIAYICLEADMWVTNKLLNYETGKQTVTVL
jgi:hypothetical protein